MSDSKQNIIFTVQPQEASDDQEYQQIEIVNAISSESPGGEKKLIFIGKGEEGTEIYSHEGGSFISEEGGSKAPLILDTNVSGAVESVIEVTNHENVVTLEDTKFTLIEENGEIEEGVNKPYECELCKKQFTKIEILKRHIKTHMKEKVR